MADSESPTKFIEYFDALMAIPFIPTRCVDQVLLGNLGILQDVRRIFNGMGLGELPFIAEPCVQATTCEFLASLTLHISPTPFGRHDVGHIQFSYADQTHEMSLKTLSALFDLQGGRDTDFANTNFNNLGDLWSSISGEDYSPGLNKASTIRHPAIRYVHKYLAQTFYSRAQDTNVEERELVMLAMGIKPILRRCMNKKMIQGDGTNVNMAAVLIRQLMQLNEEAIRPGRYKLTQLNVGSIVTAILKKCEISVTCVFEMPPTFIDEIVLSMSSFLGPLVIDKYIYRFQLEKDIDAEILLPNLTVTDMGTRTNVMFLPLFRQLFTKTNKRRGKNTAGPSTALAEDSGADEDYGPFQEALRDMERSMKTMRRKVSRVLKEVAYVRQKIGCISGVEGSRRSARKRKASGSSSSEPSTSDDE